MGFKEVSSLDADVTVALGKKNKETGKPYPKQAEGYYLGNRSVKSKRGDSVLHFLQTSEGNLGVWGTTDLNRKLSQAKVGTMVRITSTGTKPTPNGDMYTYKVETDSTNTIEVEFAAATTTTEDESGDSDANYASSNEDSEEAVDEDDEQSAAVALLEAQAARAAKAAKVQEIMNRAKSKSK